MNTMLYGLASRFYGITMLRPFQLEAAAAATALCDRDSIIVQPTGCGKSLCYQLVSLQSKKIVFVFTPTVALIHDQVRQLKNREIPAIALGDDDNSLHMLIGQLPGDPMVVYLTAEYIYGPSGECSTRAQLLKQLVGEGRVSLIALDEAHLLFEWEHFRYANRRPVSMSLIDVKFIFPCRPSFKQLQKIHQQFPTTPVMVLTATAPPDLLEMLKSIVIDPAVYKASVDRPNITFTTRKSKFGGKIPKAVMDGKTSPGKIIVLLNIKDSCRLWL